MRDISLHRSHQVHSVHQRFSPGFDPGLVPSLTGWWKADRRDLLYQDANTLALAEDDPVGIWVPPAIRLNEVGIIAGSTNKPPLKLAAAPNGKRMVYNDGTQGTSADNFQLGNSSAYYTSSARCGFMVVKADSPANNAFLLREGSASVSSAIQWLTSGPTVRFVINDGSAKNCDVAVPAGTMLLLCWRHTGGKLYGSINGGTETEVTCGNQATATSINWPARNTTDVKFKGWYGELLLMSADPGVALRNRIGRYLAGQWAGTWNRQT